MGHERSICTDEKFELLKFVFGVFDEDHGSLVPLTGNNADTNRGLVLQVEGIFIVFCLHQFNLAMEEMLLNGKSIIGKDHMWMTNLSNTKPAALLRWHTSPLAGRNIATS